jgi:hypothetical protein
MTKQYRARALGICLSGSKTPTAARFLHSGIPPKVVMVQYHLIPDEKFTTPMHILYNTHHGYLCHLMDGHSIEQDCLFWP